MGQIIRWSGARVVIVTWVFTATWVAVALLGTPTPPEPAPAASDPPGDKTGAISLAPMPAGDEDRPVEFPAVPVIAQTEPRSDSEVPPQLEAETSPGPDSRQALNVPRAAPDAIRELVQAEAGIACPPRDTLENAQAWVHERLKCERHPTPNGPWIEWAEYCPSGPLGYFVLKVKTGQQKVYLFENMPHAVWEGFKAAPSAGKFYHSEIKGKHHWFRLGSELKPSAPELTCHR